jgi:hypothetical protein
MHHRAAEGCDVFTRFWIVPEGGQPIPEVDADIGLPKA